MAGGGCRATKRRSDEATKRRSDEAPKRRSDEATKRRSNEAPKQRSAEGRDVHPYTFRPARALREFRAP
ncbi:hypothetical protein ACW910_01950 [Burkholderia ambifaria]